MRVVPAAAPAVDLGRYPHLLRNPEERGYPAQDGIVAFPQVPIVGDEHVAAVETRVEIAQPKAVASAGAARSHPHRRARRAVVPATPQPPRPTEQSPSPGKVFPDAVPRHAAARHRPVNRAAQRHGPIEREVVVHDIETEEEDRRRPAPAHPRGARSRAGSARRGGAPPGVRTSRSRGAGGPGPRASARAGA